MFSAKTSTPGHDVASTPGEQLISPKHPLEICPPSPHSSKREKWKKLKEENKERKSRELTRISYNEATALTGRDQRGFKVKEEDKQMDTKAEGFGREDVVGVYDYVRNS